MMSDQDVLALIERKIAKEFKGQINELEGAIGMLFVGRRVGWKIVMLMHDRKTVKKYEKILGIKVQEEFEPIGSYANRSVAYRAMQKITSFWKAVKGEIPGVRSGEFRAVRG